MKDPKKKLFGLILNGGLSRRMGSDKSKKMISKKSLISLVFERAKAQVDYLAINSNQKSSGNKIEIIPDCLSGNLGPLVGILSGLKWLKKLNDNYDKWSIYPEPSITELYPNMNYKHGRWQNEKRTLAELIKEITLIWNISYKERCNLLNKGIKFKTDDSLGPIVILPF